MTARLRIGIVEDNALLREDFAELIDDSADMSCVAAFESAEAALEGWRAAKPDVMLVDINLPGMNGIEFVRRIRAGGSPARIVMLTTFDDATSVFEALKAGANGFLLKRAARCDLRDAVKEAVAGGAPMTSAIARKVVEYFDQRAGAAGGDTLTDPERYVVVALGQAQQYTEIADRLGIGVDIVRQSIRGIYDKLHASSRQDSVGKLGKT